MKESVRRIILRHLRLIYWLAYLWRSLLFRTTFIAITGSVGKTTAKECLAHILSSRFPTAKTKFNQNDRYGVPLSLLRVRPWHRFAVLEAATDEPGLMYRQARLVRPHIAVVLAIERMHTTSFSSIEDTADEKADLVKRLSSKGVAILNATDPLVLKMADGCRGKVKRFGRCPGLDLWADNVSSRWPSRLSLTVHGESETEEIQTNFVGTHWVNSVLAALLTARHCGVRLRDAARALERVEPFPARMQPVLLPTGAILIRDEYNGSPPALEAALRSFESSAAKRRVLVASGFSDSPLTTRSRMEELGKVAARVAGLAVFVNRERGNHAVRTAIAAGMNPQCVRNFKDLQEAARYLSSELREGDLVLLKGRATDHLSRLFFAQFGPIGCWKTRCRKTIPCDFCEELRPSVDASTLRYAVRKVDGQK